MVAYTNPDCLPYFECSDSACLNTGTVCDHSTVFCDLVNLLDTRLTVVDNIIARTSTSIPFAKVARTSTQMINTNTPGYDARVIWDTVLEDNNDMVNLNQNSKAILIHTPGIYVMEARFVAIPPQTVSNILTVYIGENVGIVSVENDTLWRSGSNYGSLTVERKVTAAQINNFNGAYPVSLIVDFTGTIGTGIVQCFYAELSVYWAADL